MEKMRKLMWEGLRALLLLKRMRLLLHFGFCQGSLQVIQELFTIMGYLVFILAKKAFRFI